MDRETEASASIGDSQLPALNRLEMTLL